MNAASPSASSIHASRYAAISSGVRKCSATSYLVVIVFPIFRDCERDAKRSLYLAVVISCLHQLAEVSALVHELRNKRGNLAHNRSSFPRHLHLLISHRLDFHL